MISSAAGSALVTYLGLSKGRHGYRSANDVRRGGECLQGECQAQRDKSQVLEEHLFERSMSCVIERVFENTPSRLERASYLYVQDSWRLWSTDGIRHKSDASPPRLP